MPGSFPKVSNRTSSHCGRRDKFPRGDPRTFSSKRVVAVSNPTSRPATNGIRKQNLYSAHVRRNAEIFLRSLTPIQLSNLRIAIINRLKQQRGDLKLKHQLKVCDATSNPSELTPSGCQNIQSTSKDHTIRPVFATHFHTCSPSKVPNDSTSNSIGK